MKWILLVLMICLNININAQDTLTKEETQFAASYIKYLEKKNNLYEKLIISHEQKDVIEKETRLTANEIILHQNKQLEMYKAISKDIDKINTDITKFNIGHNVFSFVIGFLFGTQMRG